MLRLARPALPWLLPPRPQRLPKRSAQPAGSWTGTYDRRGWRRWVHGSPYRSSV